MTPNSPIPADLEAAIAALDPPKRALVIETLRVMVANVSKPRPPRTRIPKIAPGPVWFHLRDGGDTAA